MSRVLEFMFVSELLFTHNESSFVNENHEGNGS